MPLRELLLACSVPLLWAVGFVFAKAGLEEFTPLLLMGMRFVLTALVLVWFVARPTGHYLDIIWIALVSASLQYGLTFSGLAKLDASLAIIIVQLEVPFGVLAAAIMLGERPGLQRNLGMLIAFGGVAMIAGQPSFDGQLYAMTLTASGAAMWAVGQIMVKWLNGAVESFSLIAWVGVFAGPQMLLASWLFEGNPLPALESASWIGWGAVVYMALGMTALGYGIWYRVLARNSVTQVMPVLLLLPVLVIALGMLVLGEQPDKLTLAGALVVLSGLATILFVKSPADLAVENG